MLKHVILKEVNFIVLNCAVPRRPWRAPVCEINEALF
jgi:hypothetical protein